MAKETASWTQRLGGNRTLVLGVMIFMLVLFTVDFYVVPALGVGNRGAEFLRFTVNGREVVFDQPRHQAVLSDWQRFWQGMFLLTRRPRGGTESFHRDLMVAELARDAGLSVPDATLREFIRNVPLFADPSGEFDGKAYETALKDHFGGLRTGPFEDQARMHLLIQEYENLCTESYFTVGDEAAFKRWKRDSPKIGITYAWAATSTLRAAMRPEDLKAGEVEAYWDNPAVQARHRLQPRYEFEAAAITVDEVDRQAYLDARAEAKDDPDLRILNEGNADEGFDYFFESRKNDFDISSQSPETVDALRAENDAAVTAEDDGLKKAGADAPSDPSSTEPPVDLSKVPADKLEDREAYRRLWRFRIEKELWLKKLMGKVLRAAADGKEPLEKAAERFSRPGIRIRFLQQDQPVDQYGVENIKGFGGPNCDLRYELNQKKKEDEGKMHGEVLTLTAQRDHLKERGWLVFRVVRVVPAEVPPLDTVREKVTSELLDDRARDQARAGLEKLRKAGEDARRPLEEVAKEQGFETGTAGPFNAYSWRPPSPKPAPLPPPKPGEAPSTDPGDSPVRQEGWKDPDRRMSAVMGRYASLRDTPVGAYGPVLEDFSGSGAFYLAQVKTKEDPRFEEMSQSQLAQARRGLVREGLERVGQALGYDGLRRACGLMVGGAPAPPADGDRRAR